MERAQLHHMFRASEAPMDFMSPSWTVSALQFSKALPPPPPPSQLLNGGGDITHEDIAAELEAAAAAAAATVSGNPFSFASSETSQLIMERIMSQSVSKLSLSPSLSLSLSHARVQHVQQEVSPRTSVRLSHSSGPLHGGCGSLSDSPPVSPSQLDDHKLNETNQYKSFVAVGNSVTGRKTVGRWLKDRKEKKKEEVRAQNAQLHASVSVAGVAAAIAAITAATATSSRGGRDEQMAITNMAVASAATLVAAQCVEAAEAMGAERDHLASVVSSAVNVQSAGDIMTLTASAATALRGAATLKARALKEVLNIASVIPVDKVMGMPNGGSLSGEVVQEDNFLGVCSRELLARGCELLKRTRKGDLHWKVVSVYINRIGQVMVKMKSKYAAGTVTKKKKNLVMGVLKDVPAWPGRHLLEGGENRRYFALKTAARGVIEFECRNQREYDIWTKGVSRLLTIAADKKRHKM